MGPAVWTTELEVLSIRFWLDLDCVWFFEPEGDAIVSREGELIDAHYGFKTSKTDEYEASIVKALGDGAREGGLKF